VNAVRAFFEFHEHPALMLVAAGALYAIGTFKGDVPL
jgi:hypothetical protein